MAKSDLVPGWAVYLRVSDEDKQHPERSFAFQRQRIHEHLAAGSDIPILREYRDILTGTHIHRADYQQMLSDAANGRFSHLGVYRADRFGRDAMEGLQAATNLIGLGIKIRIAHMPSLQPETPDGFFMFLLQMGLAQREVEVLTQRSMDGIRAKALDGGWPFKAPDGYRNREEIIRNGKYRRWVEPDPQQFQVWREAWDLLLTDRYTLKQICEELQSRGYHTDRGKPWAWDDPKTGGRRYATSRLTWGFHNPFYAGWVISRHFDIQIGQVRGDWQPMVTSEEFERAQVILKRHDDNKSRSKRHHYLLRNLIMLEADGQIHRMYCSTPTGRSASYSYYVTYAKIEDKQKQIPCEKLDALIPQFLSGIQIPSEHLPHIRDLYGKHIKQLSGPNRDERLADLEQRLRRLRDEEADLARLLVTGKLSEDTYDRLRGEWQSKVFAIKEELDALQRESVHHLDDLDKALVLLSQVRTLFDRLDIQQQSALLQILIKHIIVNKQGEIIQVELQTPFAYLIGLTNGDGSRSEKVGGSIQSQSATFVQSTCSKLPNEDVGQFLSMVRFEQRAKLAELPQDLLARHS